MTDEKTFIYENCFINSMESCANAMKKYEFMINPTIEDIKNAESEDYMGLASLVCLYFDKNKANFPSEMEYLHSIYEEKGMRGVRAELYNLHAADKNYLNNLLISLNSVNNISGSKSKIKSTY